MYKITGMERIICFRMKLIQHIKLLLKHGIFQLGGVISNVNLLVSQSTFPASNPGEPHSMLAAMAIHGRENVIQSCFLVNIYAHRRCNI